MKTNTVRLAGVLLLVCSLQAGWARADISVTNNVNATDLVNVLLGGGAGTGITVTNAVLSAQDNGTQMGSGIYTAGPNNYGILPGQGIVLTSGNAGSQGSAPAVVGGFTSAAYGTNATADQAALLNQVASAPGGFHDVTSLTITFNADANTSHVFFNGSFASAEFPEFVGQFIDGFGLFLNGKNIAIVDGNPVNIDHPDMVDTSVQTQFQETALQGLLVFNNTGDLSFVGDVTPGSIGNTLTFIIGDANDFVLDTTIYLRGLGSAPPVTTPEPSTFVALGLSGVGIGLYRRVKRRATA